MLTTLLMLMSLDGKVSTGSNDERDFDKDLPHISGASKGLSQYYELEQKTDLYSFNTGKVMAKVGWNEPKDNIKKTPVSFVIVDNQPHLTERGIANLLQHCEKLFIVTTNSNHPARHLNVLNLITINCSAPIDFKELFADLEERGIGRMTIQSGGDMNSALLREGLINEVSVVIAPILVGGKETPSLIGGTSLRTVEELKGVKVLKLQGIDKLDDSYLRLSYKVLYQLARRASSVG